MKKIILSILFLVFIFSAFSFLAPKAQAADYFEWDFRSQNVSKIMWEVGFRSIGLYLTSNPHYHSTLKDVVDSTSCPGWVYCKIGGAGKTRPLDGHRPYGYQWGTACKDPGGGLTQFSNFAGDDFFSTGTIDVTFPYTAGLQAYPGGILRFSTFNDTDNCPTSVPPPSSAPSGATAVVESCGSATTARVRFSWGAVSGATSYDMYVSPWNGSFDYQGSATDTLVPLADNQTINWNVRGVNSGGNGPYTTRSFTIPDCPATPPPPPSGGNCDFSTPERRMVDSCTYQVCQAPSPGSFGPNQRCAPGQTLEAVNNASKYSCKNSSPGSCPVPPPPPPGGFCGDGGCDGSNGETCSTCSVDCGSCSPPPPPPPRNQFIVGIVYVDSNSNGVQDSGEAGYNGATVTVTGLNYSSQRISTYDPNGCLGVAGCYWFTDLPHNGPWQATLSLPAGYITTTTNPTIVPYIPDNSQAQVNFGIIPGIDPTIHTATVLVYNDANGNGTQDSGENGVSGQRVDLCTGTPSPCNSSTSGYAGYYTTDSNGQVSQQAMGSITETFSVNPSGYILTTTNPRAITMPPDQSIKFGIRAGGPVTFTISGTVYDDNNSNGVKDASEPGHSGATVRLSNNATTTSNGSGTYTFTVPSGTYTVTLTNPAGFSGTTTNPVSRTVGPSTTANFGIRANAVPNCTGLTANPTTVGLGQTSTLTVTGCPNGVPITFTYFDDSSITGDSVTNNNTNTSSWRAPSSGISTSTPANPSVRTCNGASCVNLGTTVTIVPASGIYSISGTVYIDINANGVKDTGEAGSPNTSVCLTGGVSTCGTTIANGTYSFPSLAANSYTIRLTAPAGFTTTTPNPRVVTLGPNSTVNFGINRNAATGCTSITANPGSVNVGQTSTLTTNCSGPGPYTFTYVDDPSISGDTVTNNNTNTSTWRAPSSIPGSTLVAHPGVHVCISPANVICSDLFTVSPQITINGTSSYTVSGIVYDNSTGSNIPYPGSGAQVCVDGSCIPIPPSSSGTFSVTLPPRNNYIVTISPPSGFSVVPPPQGYDVNVGGSPPCVNATNPTFTPSCNAGNVSGVNFVIGSSEPWIQSIGSDMRIDNGYKYRIPPGAAGSACQAYASRDNAGTPGVIYSGVSDADFGPTGQASSKRWVVGSTAYNETYPPGNIKSSYNYVNSIVTQNGITPLLLPPTLSSGNITNGVYKSAGNVTISGSPIFNGNRDYVFLVTGNLRISSEIHVDVGSTVFFTASGNITVDPTVGEGPPSASFCSAIVSGSAGNANLEGYYSADDSFIVQGSSSCPAADRKLNVAGSIVANASRTGGDFQNDRDLCASNALYPSFSITERADFVLNSPSLLLNTRRIFKEVAP